MHRAGCLLRERDAARQPKLAPSTRSPAGRCPLTTGSRPFGNTAARGRPGSMRSLTCRSRLAVSTCGRWVMHRGLDALGTAKSASAGGPAPGPTGPAIQPAAHAALPNTHPQRPPLQGVLGPQQSESSLQPSLSSSTHCIAGMGGGRCCWSWWSGLGLRWPPNTWLLAR